MPGTFRYPYVFASLDMGLTWIKSRILMRSMRTGLEEAEQHKLITAAEHAADADMKICLQALHTSPLVCTPLCVAPSAMKSRIGSFTPSELDEAGIETQIAYVANSAALAQAAGYDRVKIIGSAGYLLSTFTVQKTSLRTDCGGACGDNHMRLAVDLVRWVRAAVGDPLILICCIAAMDMLDGGLGRSRLARPCGTSGRRQHHQHPFWLA